MEISPEKLEAMENTIDQLQAKIDDGDDLTIWESVLMDTLCWIALDEDEPTCIGRI
ncbi:hypothetical protein [Tenacibaculum sp. 190524A02b]|uniref:hypothetical protein n=1 Tax=Tenacibaculum vairaonense TaxID=3137860 RepID=UPI0032B17E48